MPLPPIFERAKRSRLIDEQDLETVAQKTCAKLGGYVAASEEETRIHMKSELVRSLLSDGSDDAQSNLSQSPEVDSSRSNSSSNSHSNSAAYSYSDTTGYYTYSSSRIDLEIDLLDDQVKNEFERILLKKLVKKRLVNSWQAMKLRDGHTSFFLGAPPQRYRIVDQLGKGGYGAVYHAREEQFSSNKRSKVRNDVAIKVLQNKSKPEARELFMREYEIARLFKEPNIVEFRGFSNEQGNDFYVLEYVDGGDANRLLKKYGKLHYKIACYIISETAKALSYLHRNGVIHRDVKPGNILLMKTGEIRLTDFGFVSAIKNPNSLGSYTEFGQKLEEWEDRIAEVADRRRKILGTKGFIAPEQMKNPEFPNPLWDIYSLGCTFYTLLTGSIAPEPPSSAEEERLEQMQDDPLATLTGTYRALSYELPEAPPELANLVMRMLARKPNKRVQTARQVVNELKRWIAPDQRALFSKIKLAETSDHENVWSEENIRRCFNISQAAALTLNSPDAGILTQQNHYANSTSVSSIFYQEALAGLSNDPTPQYPNVDENLEEAIPQAISQSSSSSASKRPSVIPPPVIKSSPSRPRRNRGGQNIRELTESIEETRRLNKLLLSFVVPPLALITLALAIVALVK